MLGIFATPASSQPAARGRAATPARVDRSATAPAGSPYDQRARDLASRALAGGTTPAGVLPLIELFTQSQRTDPAVLAAELDRVVAGRLPEERRTLARWMRALVRNHAGDKPGATRDVAGLGFITDFQVAGPFENDGEAGFAAELPVESVRLGPFDPEARFEGRGREVGFSRFDREIAWDGYVSLRSVMRPASNVCAVAVTTVTSARAQNLVLRVGAAGAVKVYWNGLPVLVDGGIRGDFPDRSSIAVGAHAGPNRLLVKVCNTEGGLGFYARLTDERGNVATSVGTDAANLPEPRSGHGTRTQPRVDGAFDRLRAAAEAEGAPAAALEAYARFLMLTGSDDRDERKARDFAARAADAEPTVDRLELAYVLAEERGERMRFALVAEQRFPADPRTRILRARVALTGARPVDALPLLDGVEAPGVEGLTIRRLRSSLYADMDFDRAALAEARAVVERAPNSFEARSELADRYRAAGLDDAAVREREAALALRQSDMPTARAVLADRIARRKMDEARAMLEAMRVRLRHDDVALANLASVYEGLDDLETAAAVLREAIAVCPSEPARHEALGRLMLRQGDRIGAIAELHTALELRPQSTDVRDLLEDLEDTARDDEEYATAIETVLARRTSAAGYPYSVLHDLTVNTVYESGLSSSFRQFAVQVHDVEGARQFRAYGIPYEPSIARVDVRSARVYRPDGTVLEATNQVAQPMADPAYRMYYDSVNLVVVFPTLEPGDVVEIRYRVDEVASENRFANYYGDLRVLQSGVPLARLEYVLRTPSSRTFYLNAPTLVGLTRERSEADGRRIDRFVASDVPALRAEDRMPGITEVAPYLHVSTYRTWEDVGRWYWGLVRDQLMLDDELRRTVRELVAGAPDEETKVRRIHDWVVDHTRYVALEFGIHGFKPYRVTQIARRGFGDCKDKASLMYAMLREAGIDAHLVLVRTRHNGSIEELPASLAIFDHAIAYVPSLDLYIDGTAEHSGMRELPGADQGVTVLHVHPDGASLRRTPVLAASTNRRERELRFTLAADGGAVVSGTERVSGVDAAGVRAQFEAEGTREERLRRMLRGMFPGTELDSFTIENVTDREATPTVRYEARVPRIAQIDGDALRVAPSLIDELVRIMAPTPTRQLTLDRHVTSTYSERRVLTGAGLRVVELPAGGQAESRFGRATMSCVEEASAVRCDSELRVDVDRVDAADFPAYREWVEAADRLFRQRVKVEVTQ